MEESNKENPASPAPVAAIPDHWLDKAKYLAGCKVDNPSAGAQAILLIRTLLANQPAPAAAPIAQPVNDEASVLRIGKAASLGRSIMGHYLFDERAMCTFAEKLRATPEAPVATIPDQKAKFEAWAKKHGGLHLLLAVSVGEMATNDGLALPTYYDGRTEMAWRGWHAALAAAAPQAAQPVAFQHRVQPWMMTCFGPAISADRDERNHRFLEESLELVQSTGCTADEARQLVDYVFGRPVGEPAQEVGGVMVTLAALCLANDLDMHQCAEVELVRIWTKVEAIRAKQAAKPKHSRHNSPQESKPL